MKRTYTSTILTNTQDKIMNDTTPTNELRARVTVRLEYDLDNDNRWTVAMENQETVNSLDWVSELAVQVYELVEEGLNQSDHPQELGDLEDFQQCLESFVDTMPNVINGNS